jgi:hypothetical protein
VVKLDVQVLGCSGRVLVLCVELEVLADECCRKGFGAGVVFCLSCVEG